MIGNLIRPAKEEHTLPNRYLREKISYARRQGTLPRIVTILDLVKWNHDSITNFVNVRTGHSFRQATARRGTASKKIAYFVAEDRHDPVMKITLRSFEGKRTDLLNDRHQGVIHDLLCIHRIHAEPMNAFTDKPSLVKA